MADTMSFALARLAALLADAAARAVRVSSCASTIKEPEVPLYERIRDAYGRLLQVCLRHRDGDDGRVPGDLRGLAAARAVHRRRVHAASRRRRAVDPRDDALHDFVRRGVEAGAAGAQRCCSASRRSRPSPTSWDGRTTGPIRSGSSTTSTSSASSRTTIRRGAAPIRTKAQLTDAIQAKLAAFPGIIFNYTQPAEDAVDEAETGLKSSLAVKIFGADLETLEAKAEAVQKTICGSAGHHGHHAGARARAAEPDDRARPREDRAYGLNVADINTLIETAVGGTPATQVIQGERSFDLVVRLQEPFRQNMDAIKNLLIATPDGQHLPLSQFADDQGQQGRVVHLPRGQLALHRHPVQRRRAGPGERGAGRAAEGRTRRCRCRSATPSTGAANTRSTSAARSQMLVIMPHDDCADPADPVRALRQPEVPAHHHVQRAGHRSGRRAAGAEADRARTSACRPASASSR